jgi:methionine sulfoxide reductase heme-binding subunit
MQFLRARSGQWSFERLAALAIAVVPAIWLAWLALVHDLGPRPLNEAIHFSGQWAIRFVFLALAITPTRRIFQASRLILARRILGVAGFGYALLHLGLYIIDQRLDLGHVVAEIAMRIYLTIGAVALIGLLALASTSSDRAVKQLGSASWNRLHRIVYLTAVLATIHFLLQVKADIWEPTLMAGFLLWLFGYRIVQRTAAQVTVAHLIGLALVAALLTAALEAAWYALATGIDARRILAAHLDLFGDLRPAWGVVLVGLAIAALAPARLRLKPQDESARLSSLKAASGATRGQSLS